MQIPESVKAIARGNYTKYEIVCYVQNATVPCISFDTLVQADNWWKSCGMGNLKNYRIFLRHYGPDGRWFYEETVKGYNT